MINIVIEDNQAKERLVEANRLVFREYSRRFKKTIFFLLFFGMACCAYFYYLIEIVRARDVVNHNLYWEVPLFCSFLAFVVFVKLLMAKSRFWRELASGLNLLYKDANIKRVVINDEGIEEMTDSYRLVIKWQIITSFRVYKDFVKISAIPSKSVFVPIKLISDEEYKALLFYLRRTKREIK